MKQLASIFIIIPLLTLSNTVFACYNEYYTLDKHGLSHHIDYSKVHFKTDFDLRDVENDLKTLLGKLQTKPSLQVLSDYALNLVRAGKVSEALVIFERLVAKYPNEYALQANLGTTYELVGKNESALEHIKKGLELNANSHNGSEWIHVKILEAKIAMESNPNYLDNHTVLSLTAKQEKSKKTTGQLKLQLQERFPFCKGPDAVMADLFEDLGDCYLETTSYEYAKALYQIAVKYYGATDKELNRKIASIKTLRTKYKDTPIVPDERYSGIEYNSEKKGETPYGSLLIGSRPYTLNWTGISADPIVLLGYLDLEPLPVQPIETQQVQVKTPKPQKKATTNSAIISLLVLLSSCLLILIIVSVARKNRRS